MDNEGLAHHTAHGHRAACAVGRTDAAHEHVEIQESGAREDAFVRPDARRATRTEGQVQGGVRDLRDAQAGQLAPERR
ncbi:hypothetical protein ABZ656_28405 [Streptomyces sp. NPDC007095]|uniref:hypothetical protein n=1 Tax=Streptomyces sp. NPDC007095 TaxID=3154482 RepID=UPI000C7047BC